MEQIVMPMRTVRVRSSAHGNAVALIDGDPMQLTDEKGLPILWGALSNGITVYVEGEAGRVTCNDEDGVWLQLGGPSAKVLRYRCSKCHTLLPHPLPDCTGWVCEKDGGLPE